MLKKLTTILLLIASISVHAQSDAVVQEGEIGISFGGAHYFGDLNNMSALNRGSASAGVFFRKQFGEYVALRVSGHYANVGYSDKLSKIEYQRRRNLDFQTDIWEMALQGDFNFFRFVPGDPNYPFTPYVTLGIGSFDFDPYTYLNGTKYYLRKLGTEGQGSAAYPDRKPYRSQAFCFPLGMGVKYNLGRNINLALEISHRFTNTDYLDDVSTTYAGAAVFPQSNGKDTPVYLLQDRSYEIGPRIGTAGKQRGFSAQKDQYIFAELSISVAFSSYRCANPR